MQSICDHRFFCTRSICAIHVYIHNDADSILKIMACASTNDQLLHFVHPNQQRSEDCGKRLKRCHFASYSQRRPYWLIVWEFTRKASFRLLSLSLCYLYIKKYIRIYSASHLSGLSLFLSSLFSFFFNFYVRLDLFW